MKESRMGKYRWVIISLLLFSTTINYVDRQVISYLKVFLSTPVDKGGFGWSNSDYSTVTGLFTLFYSVITIFSGLLIDRIGTKLGLALSLIIWSIFGMLNAFSGSSVAVNAIIRSLFGIGEAGNFPASIKTVAEWFPKKERALATGIFNSGTNLGAMVAALFVPWCLAYFGLITGYKMAYLLTGGFGFIWLLFWFLLYNTPAKSKQLTKEEFDYIHSDDVQTDDLVAHVGPSEDVAVREKVSWWKLLTFPQTWAFFMGKFLTDGVWYFLLFWLPDYLHKQFNMSTEQLKWPTFIVYGISIIGSLFGGSLPMFFISKGMTVYSARMRAMFIIALLPLSLLSIQYFGNKENFGSNASVLAIMVLCLGAAAHQAWSANLFTTVSDFFPKKAIGSVIGIGGLGSGVGGFLIQKLVGRLTDYYAATPNIAYTILFTFCALTYIVAWIIIRALTAKKQVIAI
ncbi:MAG: major facilitator superfamily 1 [Mucilaginibacter sp.]|nr:major facilitator superfamily 1 [Mucilaginibacter sp.]